MYKVDNGDGTYEMTDHVIKQGFPPNIEAIIERFPVVRELPGVIFAWDGIIFNPSGGHLEPWLVEHEKVHFKQQNRDPEGWWERYLKDTEFRLEQELEAHRVEYRVFCRHNKDRNQRARYLSMIAGRLAAPMYGNVISRAEAARRIRS